MPYPTPVFFFDVTFTKADGFFKKFKAEDIKMGFSEITGLTQEIQVIEYRHGMMKEPAPMKKPGLKKYNNVILKRGIMNGDIDFYTWFSNYNWQEEDRIDLTITLNNENHDPVMLWNLTSVFPVKIEGAQLKANGNEIAIESLELAVEKIEVIQPAT
jgi:phage tail-like protein